MLSINGIFSWCAMMVMMVVMALTFHDSIPQTSGLSAQMTKVATEDASVLSGVAQEDGTASRRLSGCGSPPADALSGPNHISLLRHG